MKKFKFWFILILIGGGIFLGYSVYKNRQLVGNETQSTSTVVETPIQQSTPKPLPIKIYKDSIGELPCISIINYDGEKTIAVLITNTGSIVLNNSVASKIILNNAEQKENLKNNTDTLNNK